MSEKKASDLFITVGMPPSIKVHGRISPISKGRLDEEQTRELVLGLMSPAQRDEFTNTNECNFAISAKDIGRFRVSAFIQRDSVGMVLRRIENVIPTMEQLLLPPILKDLAMTKRGLVMFVGATGTGKSTSLAGMLEYRNGNSSGHIV
ncbi:MAG: type IV pili twitching motility protein PilT, partial [Bacteroidetes bacterium]|nr:type IV pili twitching motility protein PilT [Bacteroidota bacterium]